MSVFEQVATTYEDYGRTDPFYAVLSLPKFSKGRLDKEEFYEHGKQQVSKLLREIQNRGIKLGNQRAMDFGCGVGRLTNALCPQFEEVVGVDVSSTMLESAASHRKYNNARFVLNKRPDLKQFKSSQFDFVLSDITLQHIPREAAESYIREFVRVLKPEGLAIFLVPNGPNFPNGSIRFRINQFYREQVRPFHKKLRGKPPVQIHYISRKRVGDLVELAGAKVIGTDRLKPYWSNPFRVFPDYYYWVSPHSL